jgi:hypothetical protein
VNKREAHTLYPYLVYTTSSQAFPSEIEHDYILAPVYVV